MSKTIKKQMAVEVCERRYYKRLVTVEVPEEDVESALSYEGSRDLAANSLAWDIAWERLHEDQDWLGYVVDDIEPCDSHLELEMVVYGTESDAKEGPKTLTVHGGEQ